MKGDGGRGARLWRKREGGRPAEERGREGRRRRGKRVTTFASFVL